MIKELASKINEVKNELKSVAMEIEYILKEATSEEDNSAIQNELIDKRDYLENQLIELEASYAKLSKSSLKKSNLLELGYEASVKVNGKTTNMTIVEPVNADPTKGYISSESPIGQALLGKKAGEKITVHTPGGAREFSIVNIKGMKA